MRFLCAEVNGFGSSKERVYYGEDGGNKKAALTMSTALNLL